MTLLNLMLVYCWATLRGALTCWTLLKSPVFLVVFSSSCRSHCRLTGLSAALVQFVCPVDKQGNAAKTDKKNQQLHELVMWWSLRGSSVCVFICHFHRGQRSGTDSLPQQVVTQHLHSSDHRELLSLSDEFLVVCARYTGAATSVCFILVKSADYLD